MKRKLLLAALFVVSAFGFNAKAQTDVTDTYLTNAGFDDATCWTTGNINASGAANKVNGWTANGGVAWTYGTSLGYGTNAQLNSATAPSLNPQGVAEGGALALSVGWGGIISYTQEITLIPGEYTLAYKAYNANANTENNNNPTQANNYIGFKSLENSYYGGITSFKSNEWVEESITFIITKETTGNISVGIGAVSGGSGSNAKLFIDGITLTYKSFSDFEEPTLDKRSDIGGVAVDLNDFNVGAEDYTLEVQGEVGTEINIAAENITYTPTVNGLVRFVKHDGVVYAYEGAEYKGLVLSEKAAYTYANSLTTNDPETNNLLQNPSFETLGSLKSGSQYNIGEPWKWSLVNVGNIRIDYNTGKAEHGVSVLVWRGSGNNSYFSQEVASIKPYKGYKVYVSQVAGGNANADFIVGLGNAAGGYDNSSKNERFGTNQDKIHEIELVNNSVSGGYFTFRNTSNNTASSGSDPVAQIDWVGMVPSDAFAITGATSAVVLYGAAYAPAAVDDAKVALLAKIEEAKAVDVTTNVGEKAFQIPTSAVTALTEAIATAQGVYDSSSDIEEVEGATTALNTAIAAYKNAKLNAPAEGTRYAFNFNCEGHSANGNAITLIEGGRPDQGNCGLKYLAPQNVNYAQSFVLTKSDAGVNYYNISTTLSTGTTMYLTTATLGYGANNYHSGLRWTDDATKALNVEIRSASEGQYYLWNTMQNAAIAHNGNTNNDAFTNNSATFSIEKAEKATVTVSLAAGKYATRIFPFIPGLPGGVKAYTFGGVEEGNVITLNPVEKPTANVPYILENTSSNEVDITLSGYGLAKQNVYTADGLTGSFAKSTDVPAGKYVLQTQNNVQKFYLVGEETETVKMPAYRAYLTIDSAAGVKAFSFGGETTGINGVETLTDGAVESIYTINGTRVNSLQKGLNIVKMSNGKTQKVLVK